MFDRVNMKMLGPKDDIGLDGGSEVLEKNKAGITLWVIGVLVLSSIGTGVVFGAEARMIGEKCGEAEVIDHAKGIAERREITFGYAVNNTGEREDTQEVEFKQERGEEGESPRVLNYTLEVGEVRDEYTLEIEDITGEGTVYVDDDEVMGTPFERNYKQGEVANLSVGPADGWYFEDWDGITEVEADIELTMDDDVMITNVLFEEYATLEIEDIEGQGTVEVDGDEVIDTPFVRDYEEEETVDLFADPAEDWYFEDWQGIDESKADTTLTMNDDKEITAVFGEEKIVEYELTINIDGESTVEVDGENVEDRWARIYEDGTVVDLKAIPEEGWEFVDWTGDVPERKEKNETITINIVENKTITANFEREVEEYHLKFIITDENGDALKGAKATLENEEYNDTDEDGETRFENLDPGIYNYTVEKEGYETINDNINISGDEGETTVEELTLEAEKDDGEEDILPAWFSWWLTPSILALLILLIFIQRKSDYFSSKDGKEGPPGLGEASRQRMVLQKQSVENEKTSPPEEEKSSWKEEKTSETVDDTKGDFEQSSTSKVGTAETTPSHEREAPPESPSREETSKIEAAPVGEVEAETRKKEEPTREAIEESTPAEIEEEDISSIFQTSPRISAEHLDFSSKELVLLHPNLSEDDYHFIAKKEKLDSVIAWTDYSEEDILPFSKGLKRYKESVGLDRLILLDAIDLENQEELILFSNVGKEQLQEMLSPAVREKSYIDRSGELQSSLHWELSEKTGATIIDVTVNAGAENNNIYERLIEDLIG